MIYDILFADIKAAMLTHDTIKRDCLRGVVSEIKNLTVNAGKEITDDICLQVLKRSVKQHYDSIENFKNAKRIDLLEKETAEVKLLESYLPKMLSEENIQQIILEIINENKLEETKKNMGQIMRLLNQHPQAKLIDRKLASQYLGILLK